MLIQKSMANLSLRFIFENLNVDSSTSYITLRTNYDTESVFFKIHFRPIGSIDPNDLIVTLPTHYQIALTIKLDIMTYYIAVSLKTWMTLIDISE